MKTKNKIMTAVLGTVAAGAAAFGGMKLTKTIKKRMAENKAIAKLKTQGNWNTIKNRLLRQYGQQLKESDLVMEYGKEKDMINKLREKLGKSKKETVEIINKV